MKYVVAKRRISPKFEGYLARGILEEGGLDCDACGQFYFEYSLDASFPQTLERYVFSQQHISLLSPSSTTAPRPSIHTSPAGDITADTLLALLQTQSSRNFDLLVGSNPESKSIEAQ